MVPERISRRIVKCPTKQHLESVRLELRTECFREIVFATTPKEFSEKGSEKHDAHNMPDAPLTEGEQTLVRLSVLSGGRDSER